MAGNARGVGASVGKSVSELMLPLPLALQYRASHYMLLLLLNLVKQKISLIGVTNSIIIFCRNIIINHSVNIEDLNYPIMIQNWNEKVYPNHPYSSSVIRNLKWCDHNLPNFSHQSETCSVSLVLRWEAVNGSIVFSQYFVDTFHYCRIFFLSWWFTAY